MTSPEPANANASDAAAAKEPTQLRVLSGIQPTGRFHWGNYFGAIRQYIAGMLVALFGLAFGLFSPVFTRLLLSTPKAFIATVAGLAMFRVLQTAFTISFRDRFTLGALVAFLVTVTNVPIWNIGAPFWGLVFGYLISRLLERPDFAATQASRTAD